MNAAALGPRHQRVQRLRRLVRQRAARRSEAAFVAEGPNVLRAALDAKAAIEALYYAPEALETSTTTALLARASDAGVRAFPLAAGVMERVADTVTPQSVCGIVASCDRPLSQILGGALYLVCADVRDPGNLGAILRSAAAAGASGVVCCEGSADCYNPKVVRASAGALFQVPVALGGTPISVLETLRAAGVRRYATVRDGGEDYALAALGGRVALVLGNEAAGLPDVVVKACDATLSIPMAPGCESLNVAMTATILAFEIARRRRVSQSESGGAPSI